MKQYLSDRGIPLLYYGDPPPHKILCVENYCKWYCLYSIDSDGKIEPVAITYEDLEPYCDGESVHDPSGHVLNPYGVSKWAAANGYRMHDESYEIMVGRWVLESLESYPMHE